MVLHWVLLTTSKKIQRKLLIIWRKFLATVYVVFGKVMFSVVSVWHSVHWGTFQSCSRVVLTSIGKRAVGLRLKGSLLTLPSIITMQGDLFAVKGNSL